MDTVYTQKIFRGADGELSLVGRLAAGACAGMTSTFVRFNFLFLNKQTYSYSKAISRV